MSVVKCRYRKQDLFQDPKKQSKTISTKTVICQPLADLATQKNKNSGSINGFWEKWKNGFWSKMLLFKKKSWKALGDMAGGVSLIAMYETEQVYFGPLILIARIFRMSTTRVLSIEIVFVV